ncbi:MAG TPA: hypothetical protein DEF34_12495 [Desulfotomaculum sp.]|nr:MAG: hypothetical protein VR67_19390 [Peptococcaceae bacterium BRH_c8a]KJS72519.1 MAG: hypothetical protein JL56_12885 [Desulfotomaculum sp. BICA1-6]HBX24433.1 hypothetical protein [Desulfotomaculum sp.]
MKLTKPIVTVGTAVTCFLLIVSLQPFFLGYQYYFGLDARIICMPLAFLVLPFLFTHIYQNWSVFRVRYRKAVAGDRKSVYRFGTTLVMMIIGFIDIASGWVSGVSGAENYLLFPMWVWSWAFSILIFVHAYQRRRLFFSYLSRQGTESSGSDASGKSL